MLQHIMPLVNAAPFERYAELFAGGASVYFALPKDSRKTYILNDADNNILNFYLQCKQNSAALVRLVDDRCVASRTLNSHAKEVFDGAIAADNVERAWAVFYLLRTNWQHIFERIFYADHSTAKSLTKTAQELAARCEDIKVAVLECTDGVDLIRRYDSIDTLFYLDPPYVSTAQFHYCGFTQAHLDALLAKLIGLQGRFILSHYNSPQLREWAADNGFACDVIDTKISLALATGNKARQELLIYNFARGGLL